MEGFSSYTDTEYNMIIAKKTGERKGTKRQFLRTGAKNTGKIFLDATLLEQSWFFYYYSFKFERFFAR